MNTNEEINKVVKDEYPKYFESEEHVWRATSETDLGSFWKDDFVRWKDSKHPTPLVEFAKQFHWPELTPQRAAELTGDKEILEKGGDEATAPCQHPSAHYSAEFDNFYCDKCHKGMGQAYYAAHLNKRVSASGSAPEETKGASLPQCECCGKENLPKGGNFTVCNYCLEAAQEYMRLQEDSRPSPPRWIPVSERLPEPHIAVAALQENGRDVLWCHLAQGKWTYSDADSYGEKCYYTITHWYPLPIRPQTQAEKDEEARKLARKSLHPLQDWHAFDIGFEEGVAYARGEKSK